MFEKEKGRMERPKGIYVEVDADYTAFKESLKRIREKAKDDFNKINPSLLGRCQSNG